MNVFDPSQVSRPLDAAELRSAHFTEPSSCSFRSSSPVTRWRSSRSPSRGRTRGRSGARASTALASVSPALNSRGQIAFLGDGALMLYSDGELRVLAAPGDAAPDAERFTSISSPAVNDAGDVVFQGSLTVPARAGVHVYSAGVVTAVALYR